MGGCVVVERRADLALAGVSVVGLPPISRLTAIGAGDTCLGRAIRLSLRLVAASTACGGGARGGAGLVAVFFWSNLQLGASTIWSRLHRAVGSPLLPLQLRLRPQSLCQSEVGACCKCLVDSQEKVCCHFFFNCICSHNHAFKK